MTKKDTVKQQFLNLKLDLGHCQLYPDIGSWLTSVATLVEVYIDGSVILKKIHYLEEQVRNKMIQSNYRLAEPIPPQLMWEAEGLIISCVKIVDIDGIKSRWVPNFLLKMSDQGVMALLAAISIGSGSIVYGITSKWSEIDQKSEHIEKMIELSNSELQNKMTIKNLQDSIISLRACCEKPNAHKKDK